VDVKVGRPALQTATRGIRTSDFQDHITATGGQAAAENATLFPQRTVQLPAKRAQTCSVPALVAVSRRARFALSGPQSG
jgi:hypothetical protein